MIKLIKKSENKIMPWKNGLGITSEIAIEPKTAVFPNDDFTWRLSSAKITAANSFSQFAGYDRMLIVWKGDGLWLNKSRLDPLTPFHFQGETEVHCDLVKSEVLDLGLIYKRNLFSANMSVQKFSSNDISYKLKLPEGIHFLFCFQGQISVADFNMETMDTLQIEGAKTLAIKQATSQIASGLIQISLSH